MYLQAELGGLSEAEMLRAKLGFLGVALIFVAFATCCKLASGARPFWMFWTPRQKAPDNLFSVDIPAPPEVVMPRAPLGMLPPPKTSPGTDDGDAVKRAPAEVIVPALRTGYFEFDSARLTDEAKEILRENAAWLRAHPEKEVQIQGHCDERGTVEYNFNLGQRRAEAVKAFLIGLGVSADRIQTISYGEERPVAMGHDEEAWSLNRRAEFHAY